MAQFYKTLKKTKKKKHFWPPWAHFGHFGEKIIFLKNGLCQFLDFKIIYHYVKIRKN